MTLAKEAQGDPAGARSAVAFVAFIAVLSKGFDFAIADVPGLNRLTLHVLAAAAEHERHMIGERTKHALAVAKVRGITTQSRQRPIGRRRPRRPRRCAPHIERCIALAAAA